MHALCMFYARFRAVVQVFTAQAAIIFVAPTLASEVHPKRC
jgi:hypothetical protein